MSNREFTPLAYSRKDASAALGICDRTLYELVRAGRIKEFRIGRAVRISRQELEKFVNEAGEQGSRGVNS